MERVMEIVLTVADHEQNGFIDLARWIKLAEPEARRLIASVDARVLAECEPDLATDPFTFTLDLRDGLYNLIGGGERQLPMQEAMRLAPEQVSRWLTERPIPDDVAHIWPPVLRLNSFA